MTGYKSRPQFDVPEARELKEIITQADGAAVMVRWADRLGKSLKDAGLTSSQIRALFGEVRQIQGDLATKGWPAARRRLFLLRPKMAYRARKDRQVEGLVAVLDPALLCVVEAPERDPQQGHQSGGDNTQEDNFQRFVDFFEAILAYHKAHGAN